MQKLSQLSSSVVVKTSFRFPSFSKKVRKKKVQSVIPLDYLYTQYLWEVYFVILQVFCPGLPEMMTLQYFLQPMDQFLQQKVAPYCFYELLVPFNCWGQVVLVQNNLCLERTKNPKLNRVSSRRMNFRHMMYHLFHRFSGMTCEEVRMFT